MAERAERSFRIRLPARTSWEYVKGSQEAKLRALGVGPGHEDSATNSPLGAITPTWHTASQIRSLPVSPSIGTPYPTAPLMKHSFGVLVRLHDPPSSSLQASSGLTTHSRADFQPSMKHFPKYSLSDLRQSPEVPLQNSFVRPNYATTPTGSSLIPTIDGNSLPVYRSNSAAATFKPCSPESTFLAHRMGDPYLGTNEQQPIVQSKHQRQHQEGPSPSRDHFQHPIPLSYRNGVPEALERQLHEAEGGRGDIYELIPNSDIKGKTGDMAQSGMSDTAQPSRTSINLEDSHTGTHTVEAGKLPNGTRRSASGLNALAPEFKIENSSIPAISSTAGTTMRPTAPAFLPASMAQQLPLSHEFTFSSTGPVFKSVPNMARPAKSSKAIQIRPPNDTWLASTLDGEVQEDESGRITQAEGRQKRQRRISEDGLRDARAPFISGIHSPPSRVEQHLRSGEFTPSTVPQNPHRRHCSESLEKATEAVDQLKEIIDDLSTSGESSPLARTTESADSEGTAYTFHDIKEAVAFDTARTRSPCGQAGPSRTGFSDHQGTAGELPATRGSSPKRAASPGTGNLRGDEDCAEQTETFCSRRSSTTQQNSKPSGFDTSGMKSEERSTLEIAATLNKKSDCNSENLSSDVVDGTSYTRPSCREFDAVMKYLNDEDPTPDTRSETLLLHYHIPNQISAQDFQKPKTELHMVTRSDMQNRHLDDDVPQTFQYLPPAESESANSSVARLVAENARFSPSYRPSNDSKGPFAANDLGSAESAAINEWDKTLSSSEDAGSDNEQAVLEACVHNVVGNVLEDHLMPVKESLTSIRSSLLELAKQTSTQTGQPKPPGKVDSSDADDEEDNGRTEPVTQSPTKDRKTEKLKAMMSEVFAAQTKSAPTNGLETIVESIKELKDLIQGTGPPSTDVKTAVEEAIGRQMRGRSGPITSSHQSATVEKSQLQIAGLESMLKIAEGRAEDEMKARRATEDALADSQRLLRHALQDAAEQRESAEETEQSLSAFHEERHEMLRRNALLEGAQENFQRTASELTEKNTALEGILEEYRLSSAKWRAEIESVKMENKDLHRTISALRTEMEDGIDGRQVLRVKFDELQEDMAAVSQSIAQDRSLWRIKEEEYKAKCELLVSDGGRQSQRCENMSAEIIKLSEKLRLSEHEHREVTADLERQLEDQVKRSELERARLQRDLDNESQAMASNIDDVRVQSEAIATSLKSQLDHVSKAASTDRVRFEEQLQRATASAATAIENHQAFHDQVVGNLRGQNEQMELNCRDRLKLAEEKLSLCQGKVGLLEEKLEVAKSAAQAAVQAMQSSHPASKDCQPGHSFASGTMSSPPAKTSPQALRESILVLQEQLQDREVQIEELQQQLAAVDMEAPIKVKAQETEIIWLRELLGVRVDDLEDLIAALSRPVHDKEAIKDAAIRLKANIEMEQQEKERAHQGSHSFPSLAAISNLTSSPRSLPLAAAAAWGNWRKGRIAPVPNFFGGVHGHITETPSRISPSTQSVMSGLMTPPQTEIRGEYESGGNSKGFTPPSRTRPLNSTPQQETRIPGRDARSRRPVTPSLTRRSNYDMDAESTDIGQLHDTVEGGPGEEDEPFGPRIAAFSIRN
ncbi:MAG: hypothetical protein Q9180_000113 [Flavoplaca navasiana]